MSERMYRCYACAGGDGTPGVEFKGDPRNVQCPGCGLRQDDKQAGGKVATLALIHFEPPHANPGLARSTGCGSLACDPSKPTGHGPFVYTGDPRAVNCPACRQTDAFKKSAPAFGDPRFDAPATVKADGVHVEGFDADELVAARSAASK